MAPKSKQRVCVGFEVVRKSVRIEQIEFDWHFQTHFFQYVVILIHVTCSRLQKKCKLNYLCIGRGSSVSYCVIPRLHEEAYMKQT